MYFDCMYLIFFDISYLGYSLLHFISQFLVCLCSAFFVFEHFAYETKFLARRVYC